MDAMEVLWTSKSHSAHFLRLNYNFHFQGALAVLKQFLESNLVRIVKTAPLRK